MPSFNLSRTHHALRLAAATILCGAVGQLPATAHAQGFGANPSTPSPVADGVVSPIESSSSAFAGALASADPNTGAARASFPFRLEVARGKAQPSLGLSYSSVSGQREAGVGWGLGLPSIERKNASGPPNYANDPSTAVPLSASTDRFVFGGAQLVPICQITSGGTCSGAPAGEVMPSWTGPGWSYFRAEVDRTFDRFFWSDDHLTWVVERRSGETDQFGQPLRILDQSACDVDQSNVREPDASQPSGVFRWNLVRQYDAMGTANEIQYVWSQVNGAQRTYLTDIYDTPAASAEVVVPGGGVTGGGKEPPLAFAHHTHLTWVPDDPLPQDMRPRMFRASPDQLLTQVDITSADLVGVNPRSLVRSYALTYNPRGTLGIMWWRTALESIEMTGACPSIVELDTGVLPSWPPGTCPTMPQTSFGYTPSGFTDYQSSPWQSMGTAQWGGSHVDVDGDGALDIVYSSNWNQDDIPLSQYPLYYRNVGGGQFFSQEGQLTLQDNLIGGDDMEGEIFNGVNDEEGQPFYTLVGNFGLVSAPGTDIFTLNTGSWQYMIFSSQAAAPLNPSAAPNDVLVASNNGAWTNAPAVMARQFGEYEPIEAQVDVDGDGFPDWTGLDAPNGYAVVYTGLSVMSPSGTLLPGSQSIPDQPVTLPSEGSSDDSTTLFFFDANGDGLADIVTGGCVSSSCFFSAVLGKGDGTYNGSATWQIPPALSTEIAAGVAFAYLHDVNGDGFADIVVSDNSGVEVYFAQGVLSGGTIQLVGNPLTGYPVWIPPPPTVGVWAGGDNLQFADMNASGVDDIVNFDGNLDGPLQPGTIYYVDLLGGASPPLLQTMDNGLGATTELTYDTTAHLSAVALDAGLPWATQSPQNMHVVTSATTTLEGNSYAGGPYTTTYEYANPTYDKRFREFRGFDFVRTSHRDPTNSLNDDVTETKFLTTASLPTTTPDVPWDALVGLPVLTTIYSGAPVGVANAPTTSAPGLALSTTHWEYITTALVAGIDGRVIRSVYPAETDTWHYPSSSPTSGNTGSSVTGTDVYETELGGVIGGPIQAQSTFFTLGGAPTSSTLHTSTLTKMDTYGNVTSTVDNGTSGSPDVPIVQATTWTNIGDWTWRPLTTSVGYSGGSQRAYTMAYDSYGNETSVSTTLSGTVPLVQATSVPPVNAASNGTYTISSAEYDSYGNPISVSGANGFGLTALTYDPAFAQLLVQKSVYPQGLLGSALPLTSQWVWDRGFAAITSATGVDGAVTSTTYEGFGRVSSVSLPNPTTPGQSDASPDIGITYIDVANGPFQYTMVSQLLDSSGDSRSRVVYSDALGRSVVELASGGAADGAGTWICSGLNQRDGKGRVSASYAPYAVTGYAEGIVPLGSSLWKKTLLDDPFGRLQEGIDLDGTPIVQYRYNALSRDTFDANAIALLNQGGAPLFSTVKFDGHGRVTESDEQTADGGGSTGIAADVIATTVTYQATGEPLTVTRASQSLSNTYVRSMQYDSLGRIIRNIEPNTATFDRGTAVLMWTYAYDLNGQLVGTSDARGCGVNYTYDNIGRETSEDYVPCETTQPAYSAPGSAGVGTEVYNVYDAPEPGELAGNTGSLPQALAGRLSASYSRGEHTNYAYDGRGRVTRIARQMPGPSAETITGALSNRYDPWWYYSNMLYDNANRRTGQTTGADIYQLNGLMIGGFTSLVTAAYDARDIPVQVNGSYGPIVLNEQRYPDGLLQTRWYGDNAATIGSYAYDGRRNLTIATVERPSYAQWLQSTPTYTIPYTGGTPDYTTPTVLQNRTYIDDAVNNPLSIADGRISAEWPPDQGPVATTIIGYDDRYRVRSASYEYTNDASETQAANFQSTDPPPISFETPVTRSVSQTYQYDWQGNVVFSDDDTHSLLQRSSGTAVYGSSGVTPNRVLSGSNATGSYTTAYDSAGNLTSISSKLPNPSSETLDLSLTYDWDEAGHLRTAQRTEATYSPPITICTYGCYTIQPELSTSTINNAYLYDANGQRTWHSSNNTGAEAYTLEVFPSLNVQQTTWNGTEYARSATNEVAYLVAAGSSYGRLMYDGTESLPSPKNVPLHVYIQIADPLGSTSSTIDRDSGELVEQVTYLAYGQTETDYRPARWHEFREGYRYTGKEDDYDVGLTYFGARYYVPGLNRWASADPLTIHGFGADINPYSFVHGSPFRLVDPDGFEDGVTGGTMTSGSNVPQAAPELGGVITSAPTTIPVTIEGSPDPQNTDPDFTPPVYSNAVSWLQGLNGGGGGVYGPGQYGAGPLAATARVVNEHRGVLALAPLLGGGFAVADSVTKGQDGDLKGAAFDAVMAAVYVIPGEGEAAPVVSAELEAIIGAEGLEATAVRRLATAGDTQFRTAGDALAEALERHGIDPSTVETTSMYGKNPNLIGPQGQPWEMVRGLNADGELIEFEHHANGHFFGDTNEFELPHYHGPDGEHLTY